MSDEGEDRDLERADPWLDPDSEYALRAAATGLMPPGALATYARWWQLETWLRELVYVELRARHGAAWTDVVKVAAHRQTQDAAFTHMTAADSENPLAYLDYSQLTEIIGRHWDLFGYALLERRSWEGRQDELKRIRHRIGHMRRPHLDDLGRLEQTLRDLERGTFIALASYNRRTLPDRQQHHDPVTDGWIREQHPTAQRLVHHAQRQYQITLVVRASRRPWATWPQDLARAPGVLWHVEFHMRDSTVDAARLWRDSGMLGAQQLIVHMLADSPRHVRFTFAAADDPQQISDAIGEVFDMVLVLSEPGPLIYDAQMGHRWRERATNVDHHLLVDTGWNIVDSSTLPISIFGAGGEVQSLPSW